MTPDQFIAKWTKLLKPNPPDGPAEKAYSQEHFIDLCRMFGQKTPAEDSPDRLRFEKPLTKITKSKGYADVWKKGFFGWEYKGPHLDLDSAYVQLKTYSDALENPPLLITCNMWSFVIHTNFTSTVKKTYTFTVDDLADTATYSLLRRAFTDPSSLKPNVTRAQVTEEAAKLFASLAQSLNERYGDRKLVAHFLDRLIFCMFAEDVGLLPDSVFTKMTKAALGRPADFSQNCAQLFSAMSKGGSLWITPIKWFNGGLFDSDEVLDMTRGEIELVYSTALLNWSEIEPAIFGTLFERGLDPSKRAELGAHYTDPDTILRLVNPVIREPWERAWDVEKEHLIPLVDKWIEGKGGAATKARNKAQKRVIAFMGRLKSYRVLDPACGSGNFLYLALKTLKDFEKIVRTEVGMMGLPMEVFFEISPENLYGIEINPYAAELARVSVWIGELQWMIQNGYSYRDNPILRSLEQIECRDALVTTDKTESAWPKVNAIVGNPPFLGGKSMHADLGEAYSELIRGVYKGRVRRGADFVCYWFAKAFEALDAGDTDYMGFVATQSIRRGSSRDVLTAAADHDRIYNAWQDEPWINDGASLRVSLVCASAAVQERKYLDGVVVERIAADLTGKSFDLTRANRLAENRGVAFQGIVPRGSFTVSGETARSWFKSANPNELPNTDVLAPYVNASDLTGQSRDQWIIDFPEGMPSHTASQYELPFEHLQAHVYASRQKTKQQRSRDYWWIHWCYRSEMRQALAGLTRYIVTPRVSKHRVFTWARLPVLPDTRLYAIARDDDTTFGILHSRINEAWSLATASRHGVGNDPTYNARSCFESFPFPSNFDPASEIDHESEHASAIADAAKELVRLRDSWLNPPDWVKRQSEEAPNYPDRLLPKDAEAAKKLKKRSLTQLYNAPPAWLRYAHERLDRAVAQAYGWNWPLTDDQILTRLLALNIERSG